MADLTAKGDHFGCTPKYKAAIPAMCGEAMDVPEWKSNLRLWFDGGATAAQDGRQRGNIGLEQVAGGADRGPAGRETRYLGIPDRCRGEIPWLERGGRSRFLA